MAAKWLLQLIEGGDNIIFPLWRRASHLPLTVATTNDVVLQFDASPWGAGATLKFNGVLREFWQYTWKTAEAAHMQVKTGVSDHHTFWESLAFLMCAITWSSWIEAYPTMLVGDNVGSLQNSLDLKGKGPLLAVSRELAWRKARRNWQYDIAHIHTEYNKAPDMLSRVDSPSPVPWPTELLRGLTRAIPPRVNDIWKF